MIRKANINDIDNLMPLLEEHFYKVDMDKRLHKFDFNTCRFNIESIINNESAITLININNNKISGVICFFIVSSIFDMKRKHGIEFLWYDKSKKNMIKLYTEMINILKQKVNVIYIGINGDSESSFLKKKGFRLTEKVYGMEV